MAVKCVVILFHHHENETTAAATTTTIIITFIFNIRIQHSIHLSLFVLSIYLSV